MSYKKGELDSQLQVIKFTSCLPMVGVTPYKKKELYAEFDSYKEF